jgi:hypothetical protein
MDTAPAPDGLPPSLRFLKALVILLTITMIVSVITIVAVIVTRMPQAIRGLPDLPKSIVLPEGARPAAFTQGSTWFAVVTADDRILIFDRASGSLRQTVSIAPVAVQGN